MLTQERLRALLDYDPLTGVFLWRASKGRARAGSVAGCRGTQGYVEIRIDGRLWSGHRLAWLHVHGEVPTGDLDHINGDRGDNRIANLRPATRSQNNGNARLSKANTSGLKGASWCSRRQHWIACIKVDGRFKYLGSYGTPEAAHEAYLAAARSHFGEFARAA